MAKIDITNTELVWPGKYNEDGSRKETPRVHLPFQVIETVSESRTDREAEKRVREDMPLIYDVYHRKEGETFESGWKNKLIWGDNLLVMGSLLEQFAGKVDLIYIDPPFATGADFSLTTSIGDSDDEVVKEASAIEEKAYRDTWGAGSSSYLPMIVSRLSAIRDLLSEDGSLFLHCDWHVGHLLRCACDEVFGADNFLNEIVWYYYNKFQGNVHRFASNHDVVFWYRKGADYHFEAQSEARPEGKVRQLVRVWDKEKGAIVNAKDSEGRVIYRETDQRTVDDVWRISMLQPADRTENCGFPTQKPEALLDRILRAASSKGDLVADLFCGSGTTLAAAEKLGRRWLGCDLGRWAIHTTRKRLLSIENCKPFEVLNLGKYERKYWQGVTFSEDKRRGGQKTLFEYIAFILKLYGAQPLPGMQHLHGKKGRALVHVGAVDAPVTIDEVNAAVEECREAKQPELHVLGWEWEMGLNNLAVGEAKKRGVKLYLLSIPREVMEKQAVEKGDIKFFEVAHLEAEVALGKNRSATVKLTDFAFPYADLIPEEVRDKIKKWSDYVDYWAVDWDFKNDTFMQGWVAYRTRKDRSLPLKSDPHEYPKAGTYQVLVKVIDIFGNDTTQSFDVEVR